MSNEIALIKKKYKNQHFRIPEAQKEAASLWGIPCNEHGVVSQIQKEILAEAGHCRAAFSYSETQKGYYLIGLEAQTAIGGMGYAPSVWDSYGFQEYGEARAFAINKLTVYFQREAESNNSCSSNSNKKNAAHMVELLRNANQYQLNLF